MDSIEQDDSGRAWQRAYDWGLELAALGDDRFLDRVIGQVESVEFTRTVGPAVAGDGFAFVQMVQACAHRFAESYANREWRMFTREATAQAAAENYEGPRAA